MSFAERIADVRGRIEAAAMSAGLDPSSVTLVAVGKTFSVDTVKAAIDAGVTDVGENRAQELAQKVTMLGPRARWHFIGALQTNKVRQVVGTAALIHSVDRVGLADAIARRARALRIEQDVLIQVNVAGEGSKSGVEPARAVALARDAAALDGLRVRGLMTIPPIPEQAEDSRKHFASLRRVRDDVAAVVGSATELSMGMSRDFEVAVEEGATLVRVGEAIFGSRG